MARKRASMREGPLAELFRATEASQRQQPAAPEPEPEPEPQLEETVEHAPPFEEVRAEEPAPAPTPEPEPKGPDLRPVESPG